MSNHFEVLHRSVREQAEVASELSHSEQLESIRDGRTRIRSLASMLLGICGMLLSACFLILFFLLKERLGGMPPLVLVLLFVTIGLLLATLISAILSTYARALKPVATKGERLAVQLSIYRREYRWCRVSILLLVASVLCFSASLGVFASWILA